MMTHKKYLESSQYTENFAAINHSLPGSEYDWLVKLRESAMAQFNEVGLPGPKVEEWRYSNLNLLTSGTYDAVKPDTNKNSDLEKIVQSTLLSDIDGSVLVLCDGYYNESLSTIKNEKGVSVTDLNLFIKNSPDQAQALFTKTTTNNSLKALNVAMMTGGMVLNIDKDTKLSQPIQIIHITTAYADKKAARYRNFINVGAHSEAAFIESYVGADHVSCWNHHVTDINIDEEATLEIYQFQTEGNETVHINETAIDLSKKAAFKHHSIMVGGKLSRTEIKPTLSGINASVELSGAFLARDGSSHDVFTHMKHMEPECESNQIYRGVLDSGGKSAFQGKVYVAKDAQLTNADQSNKNLILDRNAEANSKPELLIYADDVKCTHGATVGELDSEALFYLNSRGLDPVSAKALLVEAFVAEVFEDISMSSVKARYLALARNWLNVGE